MLPGPRPRPDNVFDFRRSHRPAPDVVQLERATPIEPDWEQLFPRPRRRADLEALSGPAQPGDVPADKLDADSRRCRFVAHQTWQLVVPDLDSRGLLSMIDTISLRDLCVCVARLDQAERELTAHGVLVETERGRVKNPATTVAKSYREQLNRYVAEFGLSPSARIRLRAGDFGTDDGDGLFD